jgi:hypothetical protein
MLNDLFIMDKFDILHVYLSVVPVFIGFLVLEAILGPLPTCCFSGTTRI